MPVTSWGARALLRRFSVNVPMLRSCCGCCSIKLGSAVLGTAETVISVVHLLLLIISILSPEWDLLEAELSAYEVVLEVTFFCVDIAAIVVNILLLIGIGKGKPNFLLPAVVHYFIVVGLYCIIVIAIFIAYVSIRRASVTGVEIVVFSLLLFFPTKMLSYFWLVVFSCYRQMKSTLP